MQTDKHIPSWTFKKYLDGSIITTTLVAALAAIATFKFPNFLTMIVLVVALGIWLLVLYFFRDPKRDVIDNPGLVMGPCDGTVADITHLKEELYLNADVIRVGIFMSVLNVHVQRSPLAGEISFVKHKPGKFLPAYSPEAATENEYIAMVIKTAFGTLLVKQISGILARRCVNYAKPGDQLLIGQRFGLIKFGSRVELFLPPHADILVSVGDAVTGGLTSIAQMPETEDIDE